ncbi:D-cysteine desulfhydrase family protein [Desulfurococcaceae archaeon MEX13E-LK6-19]|nr:D-cysteine desulfhydrase family protein [Desulfurococcaceae archaeon MEX13E-LK6-19]
MSLPTPLEKTVRLGKELGIDLYVKRDDVMELALGGNKVRKLEFILGDALSKGCDVLVTRGAFHSNHVRLTAAAARKAGLDVYLVLTPPGEPVFQGNVLLDRLFGAKILYASSYDEADELMEKIAGELRSRGKKPYVIPGGGASPHGVLGYVTASLEIIQQLHELGRKPDYIVHATGTGATQAGLILGLKLLGLDDVEVIGISVSRKASEVKERVSKLASETAKLLKADISVEPEDVTVFDDYVLGGYGVTPREIIKFIVTIARREGLLLDPVYTGKAMYGLVDLVEKGYIKKNSTVVFIHTGGTPILFQLSSVIEEYLRTETS